LSTAAPRAALPARCMADRAGVPDPARPADPVVSPESRVGLVVMPIPPFHGTDSGTPSLCPGGVPRAAKIRFSRFAISSLSPRGRPHYQPPELTPFGLSDLAAQVALPA
jgi:hypothetical protein